MFLYLLNFTFQFLLLQKGFQNPLYGPSFRKILLIITLPSQTKMVVIFCSLGRKLLKRFLNLNENCPCFFKLFAIFLNFTSESLTCTFP